MSEGNRQNCEPEFESDENCMKVWVGGAILCGRQHCARLEPLGECIAVRSVMRRAICRDASVRCRDAFVLCRECIGRQRCARVDAVRLGASLLYATGVLG